MNERPRRILFAPETFNLGETSRAVEVATAVRGRGHDVLFMGYSRQLIPWVQEAGFDCELLSPELSDADAAQLIAVDQGRSLRHPFTTTVVRQRVESELGLMRGWQPDVLVIGSTLTTFISARVAGVPLVYVKPYPLSRAHLTTLREFPVLTASGAIATGVNRTAAAAVRALAASVRWKPRSFRLVAEEQGLPLPQRTLETLDADLNLIASLFPALDRRPLMDNDVAVGPVYARSAAELPEEVGVLADGDRPVVYLGLGSSARRELALTLLDQLARLDVAVVSSVGRYLTEDDRKRLPEHVQVHDFLPADRLAGVIDASVTHGGEGTVQTACASGVPFAGIALQTEQRVNLEECVRHGNALRFTTTDLRRGRLPGLVDRLLHDPQMQEAATRLRTRMAHLDGAEASADHILALAAGAEGTGENLL